MDGRVQEAGSGKELTARGAAAGPSFGGGGAELTLAVDFGQNGDVQDHVNWADARLIK